MIERVLVDSASTITGPIFTGADEEAADTASTPTVTVVSRLTGDTLSAPTVTAQDGAGVYAAALTTTHTADVDILDLTWTGTVAGSVRVLTQQVEVVGGFYVSVPDLRQVQVLSSAANHPTERLKRLRAAGEAVVEEALGVAFVPRAASKKFHVRGQTLRLHRQVRELVRVTFDGVEQSVSSLTVDPRTSRLTYSGGASLPWDAVVEVFYRHGYDHPPMLLSEAVREYVRAKAATDASSQNRGVSSITMVNGETYRFQTADPAYRRWTGIPEVDDRINQVASERVVAG